MGCQRAGLPVESINGATEMAAAMRLLMVERVVSLVNIRKPEPGDGDIYTQTRQQQG